MASFTVACVAAHPQLREQAERAVHDLAAQSGSAHCHPDYRDILARARAYLRQRCPGLTLQIQHAEMLADVPSRIAATDIDLLLIDASGELPDPFGTMHDDPIARAVRSWPRHLHPELSPTGTYVYRGTGRQAVQPITPYTVRDLPADPWVLAADLICAVTDRIEVRRVRPTAAATTPTTTLAVALHNFLTARAGTRWALWSYTGSIVSGLIEDLERLAQAAGNPVLRGPSEHSLACGALARWQLDRTPFLIVVTSGMVDEFRGTLANLREARAQGFIVCADTTPGRWFPFQGTIHQSEDAREVFTARRLPTVQLNRADAVPAGLREAYAAYDTGDGPVILLPTPSALETRQTPPPVPPSPLRTVPSTADQVIDDVVHLINEEPVRLLWQAGVVPPEDRDLLYDLAERAGAALADSPARPGAVAAYHHGRRVPHFLGTLGLYGTSPRLLDYLFAGDRLRTGQVLFFLGSRIAEISSPLSERVLRRDVRIVQVTDRAEHLAPFADHRVHADLGAFLRRVAERLQVNPAVLAYRRAGIADAQGDVDPRALLPVRPMTMPYFMHRLNGLLTSLIETQHYRYTGVYDVGRGGMSAIRNVARTGPGFSGWYGRALMGDALQAVPAIALTRPGNVLAFVGDGAAALVPDVLPSLLHQICIDGRPLHGNISIFRLLNASHSIIRSYREARTREPFGGQTSVLNLIDPDWSRTNGPVQINHRLLDDVDDALAAQLVEPGCINLFSVCLGHDSTGDALSLLALRAWHRQSTVIPEGEQPS